MFEWLEVEVKMVFKIILIVFFVDNTGVRDDEYFESDRFFFIREEDCVKV